MIRNFVCRETNKLFYDIPVEALSDFQTSVRRLLTYIHRAKSIQDLRALPRYKLKMVKDNDQMLCYMQSGPSWSVSFKWNAGQVSDVRLNKIELVT